MTLAPSGQQINGPASARELPTELYELVRAGISNAIDRAISDNIIAECNPTLEYLKTVFMDEISGPSPQINHFIRNHDLPRSCPVKPRLRTKAQQLISLPSDSLFPAQKRYDQDVYNISRTLGLSVDDAERWVLKAREFWSEENYDSADIEEGKDVSSSNETLDQSFREPSPGMFTGPSGYVQPSIHAARIRTSEASQFEHLESKNKSQRQKKKGRRRKEELKAPPQSEIHFGEQHNHQKGRVESEAQSVNSRKFKKSKSKKRRPQYSPFFQRSSLAEAEKNINRKVNQLIGHEPSDYLPKEKDAAIEEATMLVDFPTPMI